MKNRFSQLAHCTVWLVSMFSVATVDAQQAEWPIRFVATQAKVETGHWRLQGWTDQQTIQLVRKQDGKTVEVDDAALAWFAGVVDRDQMRIRLRDGSSVSGIVKTLNADVCRIVSRYWQPIEIPTEYISGIEVQVQEQHLGIPTTASQELPTDVAEISLVKGTVAKGKLISIDEGWVRFDVGQQPLRIPIQDVRDIRMASQTLANETATVRLQFVDGTRLNVKQQKISDQTDQFDIEGLEWTLLLRPKNGSTPSQLICGLEKMAVNFLTETEPQRYQHQPMLGTKKVLKIGSYHFEGGSRSSVYFGRSMLLHSRSSVVYTREQDSGNDSNVQFGIVSDTSDHPATVNLKMLILDADNQWQPSWQTSVENSAIKFFTVPAESARAVAITVDYEKNADLHDGIRIIMPRWVEKQ